MLAGTKLTRLGHNIFMLAFFCLAILIITLSHNTLKNLPTSTLEAPPILITGSKQRGQNPKHKRICSSATRLYGNLTSLEESIEQNIHFHQQGGNLNSIELYLNKHQQSTLDALGIQFTPDGADAPAKDAIQHLGKYYSENKVKRGGYGQPLPGKLSSKDQNRMVDKALFEKRWINVLEPPSRERYVAGAGPVNPCPDMLSFSEGTYEEKTMCVDAKSQHERLNGDCNIYSIGSNDQWGFEMEVHDKMPGCVTHTFDCTLKGNIPRKKPQTDDYRFYPYCIGAKGAQTPYLDYERLVAATETRMAPKLLKMDVEGFEYDVVNSIFSSDPAYWPEQIMMEVHWASRMVDLPWMTRTRTAGEIALFFGMLFNMGGYILSSTRTFDGCEPCMEILLVRALC